MEKLDDKNEDRETVTLILEKNRFEVDKQNLMKKSRYFAALLSSNYVECHKSEHVINYEIPLLPFQNFINWMHGEKIENLVDHTKKIDYVLTLLELSVLFAVDELTDNIIEEIEEHYLLPDCVIDIWLFAQELSLTVLQDLCLATCLDRFAELPHKAIHKLPKDNFLELVNNVNLRCSDSEFEDVVYTWTKSHQDKDTLPESSKQPKMSYGIVSSESFHITNELYLHRWDGNRFFELDTFRFPKDFPQGKTDKDPILGMQIIGRGCYLYFIGGEFTIGSGKFNTKVWRYSLITRKWFCYAVMPSVRRHMIAAFVGSKLLLVGGVGRYRAKLSSVDVYDVHTGKWSRGVEMPVTTFTSVPEHYVFHKKLILYNDLGFINLYCPYKNVWTALCFSQIDMFIRHVPILPLRGSACYIDVKSGEITFKSLVKLSHEDRDNFTTCDGIYSKIEIISRIVDDHNPCMMFLSAKILVNESEIINLVLCSDPGLIPLKSRGHRYYLYSSPIRDSRKFSSLLVQNTARRLFPLINPADLHAQRTTCT
ncbi:hypothetical protein DMN91_012042 [Ooceraea biroi]|uniref:BTB domain-containing protein n=1 Tax=Ooceraea biroi TaxID=2015173 RepID=A0A3L8D855_OOCBI|nr:uncharacterized protein LOC105285432 [Ooceraea biroi]RLU16282.1 hypothetical protein DMN91_012042 [Ooceraea biroi]